MKQHIDSGHSVRAAAARYQRKQQRDQFSDGNRTVGERATSTASFQSLAAQPIGGDASGDNSRPTELARKLRLRMLANSAVDARSTRVNGINAFGAIDRSDARLLATYYPNDPRFRRESNFYATYDQWGLHNIGPVFGGNDVVFDADIDLPEAWTYLEALPKIKPKETIVAVFDSGVDWQHPDLRGRMWVNPREIAGNGIDDDRNGLIDDVYGYDFGDNDGDPMDADGHGTHVAGIIAASHNNLIGITGINPHSRIMAIKITDRNGKFISEEKIAKAIDYAVSMGATIANHSWGANKPKDAKVAVLEKAIKKAGARGMLSIFAGANDTDNNDFDPFWPANIASKSAITVASSTIKDTVSGFSNYGQTKVQIAAPGSDILSTYPRNMGEYELLSGTSMAAPMVAGVASLVKSVYPKLKPAQIRKRILRGADKLAAFQGVVSTGGRLNAFRALHQTAADPLPERLALSSQWKTQGELRYQTAQEFRSHFEWADDGDRSGGKIGNFFKQTSSSVHVFDIPAFRRPITGAYMRIPLSSYNTPDSSETIVLNQIENYTIAELQNPNPSGEAGATGYQDLVNGRVLGSISVATNTPDPFFINSGTLGQWYELPFNPAGLTQLNKLRLSGGALATSMSLRDTRPPSLPFGFVEWEELTINPELRPEIVLEFAPVGSSLSIESVDSDKSEGSSPTATNFEFLVTRTGDSSGMSSASWRVSGTGANPATAGDFAGGSFPSGTVRFPAGSTAQTISVRINADTTVEEDEFFQITLTDPSVGTTINSATALGVIKNDDARQSASIFTNQSPIVINSFDVASPWPSSIVVDGLTGALTKASVVFHGLSHTHPDDIDAVLMSPAGVGVLLMSDSGGALDITDVIINFSDFAQEKLPDDPSSPLQSGTYKPSNWPDIVREPNGDFQVNYSDALSSLNGISPNGRWDLYIRDDWDGDQGRLSGGWSLILETL